MSYNISQSSSFKKFHDDPKFIFHQETVVHFNNVGIVIVTHDDNLEQMTKMMAMNFFSSVKRFVVSNPWTMGGFPVIFSRRKNDRGIVYKQQCLFCFICNIHRGFGTLWGGQVGAQGQIPPTLIVFQ